VSSRRRIAIGPAAGTENANQTEERIMFNTEQIAQLEREIEEIKARMPKHSVPPSLIIELEDLEDELEELRARESRGTD